MEKNIAVKWEPPKWWLISNETVEAIKHLLSELPADDVKDIQHELSSGLWVSSVAPANFEPTPEA